VSPPAAIVAAHLKRFGHNDHYQVMKSFTIRGATAPPALARFDAAVQAFMEKNDLRAGALAVAKNGRLVFAHGYTFGEPNYPITYPTSLFRTASASKPLTGVGIYQLLESGALSLDDKVANILNLQQPEGTPFNDVTIDHLLRHQGGWVDQPTFFKDHDIAKAFGHPVPVSIEELISWGVQQELAFAPGTDSSYSNFGYLLLGRVIAAKRNQPYADALRTHALAPLGVRRAFMARTRLEGRYPGEVKYHYHVNPPKSFPSTVVPNQQSSLQYGGENYANFEGFGGWVISAPDYVRFLVGIDDLLTTPVADLLFWQGIDSSQLPAGVTAVGHGAVFGGGTFGFCRIRTDGIALAGFWNTTHDGSYEFDAPDPSVPGTKKHYGDHETCWHDVANRIEQENAWPDYDLFGQHFPHVTRLDGRLNGKTTQIVIETLHPDGTFNGTIADGSQKSAIEGFWDGRSKRIDFVRNVEPGKPSSQQFYRGYLMENEQMLPGSFAGTFQAFAGTGGTAKRNVFAWVAAPELIVDTSTIND
jgi:CubicO group peptidase (beta-lactamase class C family)